MHISLIRCTHTQQTASYAAVAWCHSSMPPPGPSLSRICDMNNKTSRSPIIITSVQYPHVVNALLPVTSAVHCVAQTWASVRSLLQCCKAVHQAWKALSCASGLDGVELCPSWSIACVWSAPYRRLEPFDLCCRAVICTARFWTLQRSQALTSSSWVSVPSPPCLCRCACRPAAGLHVKLNHMPGPVVCLPFAPMPCLCIACLLACLLACWLALTTYLTSASVGAIHGHLPVG